MERHKRYDTAQTRTPDRFAVLFVNGREMDHVARGSRCPRRETHRVADVADLRRNAREAFSWIKFPRGAKVGAAWTQTRTEPLLSLWHCGQATDIEPAEAGDHGHEGFGGYFVSIPVDDGDGYHAFDEWVTPAAAALAFGA